MARKTVKPQTTLLDLLSTVKLEPEGVGPALRDQARATLARDQLQLDRLEIENLWSYKKAFLQFEPGITVIAGANGSGKSSLLESIFFALYGSEARHVIGRNLEEILRIGADSGSVRLSFFHGGHQYTAQIALRKVSGVAKSERNGCQLTCDDGSVWVGTENVVAQIERLFGMDREGFANCVYVRQGEIDRLIRADRKTREQMLDGLLGLYKLDLFVTPRSREALKALNRKADSLRERVARLRQEIDALEREELPKRRVQLTAHMERVLADLKTLDEQRTNAYKLLQSYDDSLKQFAQATAELRQIEQELADKERRLVQREAEYQECESARERLSARHQKALSALKANLQKAGLHSPQIVESLDQATSFEEVAVVPTKLTEIKALLETQRAQLQAAREEVARLIAERTQRERTLMQIRQQQSELNQIKAREDDQIMKTESELISLEKDQANYEQTLRARFSHIAEQAHHLGVLFSTEPQTLTALRVARMKATWVQALQSLEAQHDQVQRAVVETQAHCEALRRELEHKRELLQEGRCPTCGQEISPEHVAEALKQIEPKIAELENVVQQEKRELERITEKLTLWKQVQTDLESVVLELERLEARRAEGALKRATLTEARTRQRALQERLAQLDRQIAAETQTITTLQVQEEQLAVTVQTVSQAFNELLDAQEKLEKIKSETENLLRLRDQWNQKQAARKTLLESLNELRGDIARLHDRRTHAQERLKGQSEMEVKRAQLLEKIKIFEQERQRIQEQYDHIAHERGIVQGRLEHLHTLHQELAQALQDQERITQLHAELGEIVSVYQMTKVELRKRNLEALNYYFNEFFSLMDSGDSYSRVTVRNDYEIEVALKNGRKLNPSLMSGGERALTNIALRCAIHQVLAKAVRKMPLILDEPTIYLDRDRVHRLQFLLEDLGRRIGQVIVVSHEVGLVEGADHEYRTEKGSDNISTIYKVR